MVIDIVLKHEIGRDAGIGKSHAMIGQVSRQPPTGPPEGIDLAGTGRQTLRSVQFEIVPGCVRSQFAVGTKYSVLEGIEVFFSCNGQYSLLITSPLSEGFSRLAYKPGHGSAVEFLNP